MVYLKHAIQLRYTVPGIAHEKKEKISSGVWGHAS